MFTDDFLDMVSDVLVATPGVRDEYGNFIPSGAILSLPCRVEGKSQLNRDQGGHLLARDQTSREVVSTFEVIVIGYNDLTVNNHRYTLPSRYSPRTLMEAIRVEKETDEEGPCYEIVHLPP